jgi:Lrp/AsnC family transcriptional regulator for asnA, asnC and gidA
MRKNSKLIRLNNNNNSNSSFNTSANTVRIDDLDMKVIELLTFDYDNKAIANKLKIPLSTIQRRTRKLVEKELVVTRTEPNYEKLGFKRGLIHVYLNKGELDSVGQKLSNMKGIISASVHVGNSDIVGFFIYRNTRQLLKMTADVKKIQGVDRVMWSEEVYSIPRQKSQNGIDTNLFL